MATTRSARQKKVLITKTFPAENDQYAFFFHSLQKAGKKPKINSTRASKKHGRPAQVKITYYDYED